VPGSHAPAREHSALRVLRGALLDRLPLKAVALFFAFVLWLAVSADEPGEQTMAVRLALRVDSTVALRGARPSVSATVTGRRRDLRKLDGGDLVLRRTITAAAADSVRLVLRPADVELPSGLEGDLRVRDVQPRVLMLRFARLTLPSVGSRETASAPLAAASTRSASVARARTSDPSSDTSEANGEELFGDTVWQSAPDSVAAPNGPARPRRRAGSAAGQPARPSGGATGASARDSAARDSGTRPGAPPATNLPRADSASATEATPPVPPRATPQPGDSARPAAVPTPLSAPPSATDTTAPARP
jgi:hypothetical protein